MTQCRAPPRVLESGANKNQAFNGSSAGWDFSGAPKAPIRACLGTTSFKVSACARVIKALVAVAELKLLKVNPGEPLRSPYKWQP